MQCIDHAHPVGYIHFHARTVPEARSVTNEKVPAKGLSAIGIHIIRYWHRVDVTRARLHLRGSVEGAMLLLEGGGRQKGDELAKPAQPQVVPQQLEDVGALAAARVPHYQQHFLSFYLLARLLRLVDQPFHLPHVDGVHLLLQCAQRVVGLLLLLSLSPLFPPVSLSQKLLHVGRQRPELCLIALSEGSDVGGQLELGPSVEELSPFAVFEDVSHDEFALQRLLKGTFGETVEVVEEVDELLPETLIGVVADGLGLNSKELLGQPLLALSRHFGHHRSLFLGLAYGPAAGLEESGEVGATEGVIPKHGCDLLPFGLVLVAALQVPEDVHGFIDLELQPQLHCPFSKALPSSGLLAKCLRDREDDPGRESALIFQVHREVHEIPIGLSSQQIEQTVHHFFSLDNILSFLSLFEYFAKRTI